MKSSTSQLSLHKNYPYQDIYQDDSPQNPPPTSNPSQSLYSTEKINELKSKSIKSEHKSAQEAAKTIKIDLYKHFEQTIGDHTDKILKRGLGDDVLVENYYGLDDV